MGPMRWVFIRGLVRESAHWDDFPDRFVAGIPEAAVDLVDLPGNGPHWRVASPLSLRAAMESVRSERLARPAVGGGASTPMMLFSISLGSMVAIEWMNRYPAEVAGAVLVNTSLRALNPVHQRLSWRVWPMLFRTLLERDVAARERRILELTAAMKSPAEIEELVASRVAIHRQHPVRPSNVLRQLIAAARYAPPQRKPQASLLLLSSRGDRLVDSRCTDALAAAWRMIPQVHPVAGHDLPLDDPDWTIRRVGEWLGVARSQ